MMSMIKCLFCLLFFTLSLGGQDKQILGIGDFSSLIIKDLKTLGFSAAELKETPSASTFQGAGLFYINSSSFSKEIHLEKAMELAQTAGCTVAIDLTNFTDIHSHRERLFAVAENFVDLLILDEKDACAWTLLPPPKAIKILKNFCPIVMMKTNEGCWVASHREIFFSNSTDIRRDVSAAFAVFNTGLLYGFLKGYPLRECASLANRAKKEA